MAEVNVKRKSKPKFRGEDFDTMVEGVKRKKTILFSKFTGTVTNEKKGKAWKEISEIPDRLKYTRTSL